MVEWLAGVSFQYQWEVEGQGQGCGLSVGGGPILVKFFCIYVVGGVKEDCRNIFHECYVCGFLRAVLEQQASLVFWRYLSP